MCNAFAFTNNTSATKAFAKHKLYQSTCKPHNSMYYSHSRECVASISNHNSLPIDIKWIRQSTDNVQQCPTVSQWIQLNKGIAKTQSTVTIPHHTDAFQWNVADLWQNVHYTGLNCHCIQSTQQQCCTGKNNHLVQHICKLQNNCRMKANIKANTFCDCDCTAAHS